MSVNTTTFSSTVKKANDKLIEKTKILVVDDQAQSYFKFSLDKIGFNRISYATHAQAAIKECEQTEFDVLICSYNLSKGRDGYQLVQELKLRKLIRPSTGLIFVSSETDPELVHAVVEMQPDAFLVKPFTMKELNTRMMRILMHKYSLRKAYVHIDKEEWDDALALLNEDLENPDKAGLYPLLLKAKGDVLLEKKDFELALSFFRSIINVQKFAWAKIGLVQAMIGNGLYDEAEKLLVHLAFRPDTKLASFELMGEIQFHRENYEDALESNLIASEISPRNIGRQRTIVNLARLDHDFESQLKATKHIAKYAKNSVYDRPETYLNIARASIDLALIESDLKSSQLLQDAEATVATMVSAFPKSKIDDQINIVNARICLARNHHDKANRLIKEVENEVNEDDSMEDLLDKSKAYHAAGLFEQAQIVIDELTRRSTGDDPNSQIFTRFIAQTKQEQEDIKRTPKQLNNDAVNFYERGDMENALEAFQQAFIFMPKNLSIALNLLQTIVMLYKDSGYNDEQKACITKCMRVIENGELSIDQEERYGRVKEFVQIEEAY